MVASPIIIEIGGGKLRSVRALRGIDSRVTLNKGLWGLAERIANGETLPSITTVTE